MLHVNVDPRHHGMAYPRFRMEVTASRYGG